MPLFQLKYRQMQRSNDLLAWNKRNNSKQGVIESKEEDATKKEEVAPFDAAPIDMTPTFASVNLALRRGDPHATAQDRVEASLSVENELLSHPCSQLSRPLPSVKLVGTGIAVPMAVVVPLIQLALAVFGIWDWAQWLNQRTCTLHSLLCSVLLHAASALLWAEVHHVLSEKEADLLSKSVLCVCVVCVCLSVSVSLRQQMLDLQISGPHLRQWCYSFTGYGSSDRSMGGHTVGVDQRACVEIRHSAPTGEYAVGEVDFRLCIFYHGHFSQCGLRIIPLCGAERMETLARCTDAV